MKAQFHNLTHLFEKVVYHIDNGTFVVAGHTTETFLTQLAILLAAALSFVSNLVIILASWKSCNTLNTNLNALILRISILGNLVLLLQSLIVFEEVENLLKTSEKLFSFCEDLWSVFMMGIFCFMLLIKVMWFTQIYCPKKRVLLDRFYSGVVWGVYLLMGVFAALHVWDSFNRKLNSFPLSFSIIFALFYTMLIPALNLYHLCHKRSYKKYIQYSVDYLMPNVFLISWLPVAFNMLFAFHYFRIFNITRIIAILNAFYNLLILYFHDQTYNVAIKNLFRCRGKLDHPIMEEVDV